MNLRKFLVDLVNTYLIYSIYSKFHKFILTATADVYLSGAGSSPQLPSPEGPDTILPLLESYYQTHFF